MTSTTESVRADSAQRQVEQKQVNDWSGKRFVPPRGTSLPAVGLPNELFALQRSGLPDQLYMYDEGEANWSTVGPRT